MKKNYRIIVMLVLAVSLLLYFGEEFHFFDKKGEKEVALPANTSHPKTGPGIEQLTHEDTVIAYIRTHQTLPGYYITKSEARKSGWDAGKGNLCEVLPGKAIGGDRFMNREKALPERKERTWYEADINYDCNRRDAQRLVYSNDGLIYITKDHYKTFQQR